MLTKLILGAVVVGTVISGGVAVDSAMVPEANAAACWGQECSKRSDRNISSLFEQIRRNPEKRDEAKISVTCLRRAGVVGSPYSERQWRSEDDSGVFSFDEWYPAAVHPREDPLGLGRTP
jgi:hypothetical protein